LISVCSAGTVGGVVVGPDVNATSVVVGLTVVAGASVEDGATVEGGTSGDVASSLAHPAVDSVSATAPASAVHLPIVE